MMILGIFIYTDMKWNAADQIQNFDVVSNWYLYEKWAEMSQLYYKPHSVN